MTSTGVIVNCNDLDRRRYGTRFVATTPEHGIERFRGKTICVRSCDRCGAASVRDSSLDSYTGDVPQETVLDAGDVMAKEFKDMLVELPGHEGTTWGLFPDEFEECTVTGMIQLTSLANYYELRLTCPGCNYSRE